MCIVPSPGRNGLRAAISAAGAEDETDAVRARLADVPFSYAERRRVLDRARELVAGCRRRADERSILDLFLQEFGLSNEEGIALMCISEALLRIPDDDTAEALIAEKIATANWAEHVGQSDSVFLNASTWALMLTGSVIGLGESITADVRGWINRLAGRLGESVARAAMSKAVRILGAEFVQGRTVEEALVRADGALASFDMLGEGARTYPDADRHRDAYLHAIRAIGDAFPDATPTGASGISIKLSALHPRYEPLQEKRVLAELHDTAKHLAAEAAARDLHLTIDAEEAERLELSLALFETLAREPELEDWRGLGLAVQAYSKRATAVIDWLAGLGRPVMVRLVKGAYWDHEIKRAQVEGLAGYPVYTRKPSTDLAYIACAARLFANPALYPQFATHNAYTVSAVLEIASGTGREYEFQRLHGMGELLYDEARRQFDHFPPVRIYAPVGPHKDLLAYLVRRLLENGANSSFVNRFLDDEIPVADLVRDPMTVVTTYDTVPHPRIPLPRDLFGTERKNSTGLDLGDAAAVHALLADAHRGADTLQAGLRPSKNPPSPDGQRMQPDCEAKPRSRKLAGLRPSKNPPSPDGQRMQPDCEPKPRSDKQDVGERDVPATIARAQAAFRAWETRPATDRRLCFEELADLIEADRPRFVDLLAREAGKTLTDAVAEVREAADFCRYYGRECERLFGTSAVLAGPTGEDNRLTLRGRGVFACISPWNFPLAIFTGQVVAALAAGNTVVAKPAPQTPAVAGHVVRLMQRAGIPPDAVCLAASDSAVGAAIVAHEHIAGVAFTGSTATAKAIQRALAAKDGPIVPLIAETGGQNAMVVDSTALLEQVVDDVVASAFHCAGQRCSALRVLYVQDDIAEALIEMLAGAMDTLMLADPSDPATDVGPVIDVNALRRLNAHVEASSQRIVHRCRLPDGLEGTFCPPTMIEIESIADLDAEHFGPILHVARFASSSIDDALADVANAGFGLTLGVHSRMHRRAEDVMARVHAGNTYINRDMVGAVVGVQPFGGEGLSGTGPKAGGPHYLPRFAVERTVTWNTVATGGNAELLSLDD